MENYFNLNIVELIGLLIAVVAVITIIFSIVVVIIFRNKNKIGEMDQIGSNEQKQFEFITPVILKRIENVTRIVEEKRNVQIIESENEQKNKSDADSKIEKKEEIENDKSSIKDENISETKVTDRDISERYKIENRFSRKPKTS